MNKQKEQKKIDKIFNNILLQQERNRELSKLGMYGYLVGLIGSFRRKKDKTQ